jgi:DtxR family Mn-dependent transcriptional regulator
MTTPSESIEMYLITIYRLTQRVPYATTKDIATLLGVSAPSVSERLKYLAQQDYVHHEWREGTILTPRGERIAVNVLRKHRLVETFLVQMAGYTLDEVHEEACAIEHAISDRLADRLEVMLNYPQVDPHPIPTKAGEVALFNYPALTEISPGATVVIRQVSDWDKEQLQYLCQLGLAPEVEVTLIEAAPFAGPLTLQIGQKIVAVARELAHEIRVSPQLG